jgi:hypothetical protein
MNKYPLLFCVLLASLSFGCGHFPIGNVAALTASSGDTPPELKAFLREAETAATQILKEDNLEEWNLEYEKVKQLCDQIPREGLRPSLQKVCDDIISQMLLGKLAIGLKKDDAYAGRKRCHDVSAELARLVKDARNISSRKK